MKENPEKPNYTEKNKSYVPNILTAIYSTVWLYYSYYEY